LDFSKHLAFVAFLMFRIRRVRSHTVVTAADGEIEVTLLLFTLEFLSSRLRLIVIRPSCSNIVFCFYTLFAWLKCNVTKTTSKIS